MRGAILGSRVCDKSRRGGESREGQVAADERRKVIIVRAPRQRDRLPIRPLFLRLVIIPPLPPPPLGLLLRLCPPPAM